MEYVFNNLDIDNIRYGYGEGNYKSKGLSEKIGFKYYRDYNERYVRFNKDIKNFETIMSKDDFRKLYGAKSKK